MGMQDGHNVGPCPVDLAVNETLGILWRPLAPDRLRVKVAFNDIGNSDHAWRYVGWNKEMIGIAVAADADVTGPVCRNNSEFRQHPAGNNQFFDSRLIGIGRRL